MTKWSHEEVRDLYKRAEEVERRLAFLARSIIEGRMTPTDAVDALHHLASYQNPFQKVALLALGKE